LSWVLAALSGLMLSLRPFGAAALSFACVVACAEEDVGQIDNLVPDAVIVGGSALNRGVVASFDGSSSTDSDGTIVAYRWDFGDGGTASGATAQYIFNAGGAFTVSLEVEDDGGATDVAVLSVSVADNDAPVAVIVADDAGSINQSLRFDGSQSTDSDGTVTAYSWDFGDGSTGTGPLFDKTYTTAGTYVVELTVTDDKGGSGSAEHTIVIADAPPSFSGDWNWFLTDESLRDLGGACGSFLDSQLEIVQNGGALSITEVAGNTRVAYSGTLTGDDFFTENESFLVTQRIFGTFTSATTFTGTYQIDAGGIVDCADRPVEGIKQ
jgi:PKD repeat protein